MKFFDTCKTMGVATEIMGITPEGRTAIDKMKAGIKNGCVGAPD